MTDKRIFDNPIHIYYGPVRCMWVVLVQLDLLDVAERWGERQKLPWDKGLADVMLSMDNDESKAQRWLLRHLLKE